MWPKRWFLFVDTGPATLWRVGRVLLQCNIPAELITDDRGTWLYVDNKPNLMLALGQTAALVDYGVVATDAAASGTGDQA